MKLAAVAVIVETVIIASSVISRLRTGLGVVALMASVAIVLATVSLVISGRTAQRIKAMNEPVDADTDG